MHTLKTEWRKNRKKLSLRLVSNKSQGIKLSQETELEELAKNRAYVLTVGGVKIVAMKFEDFKALQPAGRVGLTNIGLSGSQTERNDWLVVVTDMNNLTMPSEVWVKKVAAEISTVTGSNINGISVVSGDVKVTDFAQGTATVGLTAEVKVLDLGKATEQVQIEKSEDKPTMDKKRLNKVQLLTGLNF